MRCGLAPGEPFLKRGLRGPGTGKPPQAGILSHL